MRAFNNLSALPGHTIIIDGEAYSCPGFVPGDIQGSVRKVPGDRVLAVQWHGDHNHGSIEGFGALEGLSDKSQLAPYVSAWLRARLEAKKENLAAIQRRQTQTDEVVASQIAAAAGVKSDVAALDREHDAERIMLMNRQIDAIEKGVESLKRARPTDTQIATVRAELAAAQAEVDADV